MSDEEKYSEEEEDLTDEDEDDEEEEERQPVKQKGKAKRGRQAEKDEDEDEDEEDERHKNAKRNKASIFFDEEADIDDEEEDEAEGDEHDGLIDDEFTESHEDHGKMHELHASMRRNREAETEQTNEELERYVDERYVQRVAADSEIEDGDTTAIGQQSLLPTIRDTKLWVMQCRPGAEREIAICMMQKCFNMASRGTPLTIKSVFFQDHLQGYMYIEADKESHVKNSMQGMRGIFQSKGVKLVPIAEMVDAVTVNTKAKQQIERDSWVRMKTGIYKGDLARVVEVNMTTQRCTVKLIPRLDYNAMVNKEARVPFGQQPKVRPIPKGFSIQEAKDYGLQVQRQFGLDGDVHFVGSHRFVKGYTLRVVSLKGVVPLNDIMPPVDELQRFNQVGQNAQDDDLGLDGELSSLMASVDDSDASRPVAMYEKGDKVVVIEGDLKELTGRVTGKSEDGKIIVMPDMQDLNEALTFDPSQLSKFFMAGDHVKCINGKHNGHTGMVVKSVDGICVVFSDMTQKEFRVFARDLAESKEIATGLDKIGEYDLHDLVVLDHQTVGVIVHVEKDACKVLTNQGTPDKPDVRICRLPDIKRSIPSRIMRPTTDMNANQVSVNDQVSIADGPLKGRQAVVKYIQRGMLFLQSTEVAENAGFCVIRARNVRAKSAGGAGKGGNSMGLGGMTPQRMGYSPASPAAFSMRQSPANPGLGRGGPGGRGPTPGVYSGGRSNHARRDNSLVGQTIRISKGPWCGYSGRVVDATETVVRLELEAQNRTVTVSRSSLKFTVSGGGPGGRGGRGGRGPGGRGGPPFGGRGGGMAYPEPNPFHGGSTPSRGSMTPAYGGATPAHPSMTPTHGGSTPRRGEGGRTPMRDSAWNPISGATPLHPGTSSGALQTPSDDPYATKHGTPLSAFDKAPGTPGDAYGGYHNASTPGAAYTPYNMADTPNTPADNPYTPAMTPGGADISATPGTPGGGYGAARTPYDSAATPGMPMSAATPGAGLDAATPFTPGTVGTPGLAHTPSQTPFTPGGPIVSTPGTPGGMEPMSPGLGAGGDADLDSTLLLDVLVEVNDKKGVVTSADGETGTCVIQVGSLADNGAFEPDGSPDIRCHASEVLLVQPQKKNHIKVVRGEHRGQTGSLIGVDVADGIVKLDINTDIKIIELRFMGRIVNRA